MSLVSIPKICMLIIGIWPSELIENPVRKRLYMIHKYILIIFVFSITLSLTIEWLIIYLKNKVPQMFLSLLEFEADLKSSDDAEVKMFYRKILKNNRYLNIGVIIATFFTISSFVIIHLAKLWQVGVAEWDLNEAGFMYELYVPFDMKKYIVVVLFYNLYTATIGGVLNIMCLITMYTLIIFSALQLSTLSLRIKKFHTFVGIYGTNIQATLKVIIKQHQKSIEFVDNLNKSVRYVVFIDFLLNSANVASVLFYLVTVKSVYLFYAILLLSLQLLQVFALAWVSNEVKLESVKVADAVYESPWYEQDQKIKKMLHIILMRSQKPLAITIGPFKPMTAETAIMTLQASYSYATLMMNSYKDE
ncbi:hypothetical protein GWI33_021640 [Rhynchophorus ferrugineus]|uniref:Odorant receptor n=1 Tax=Rhynchophorus ferrugineus TaxID=354439 RepID=A0A834J122_RHYFE|nr:hypothetical protein GWI33_021640 [Rhynchophorus ferrugineus]